ncbi:phage virion morphogenesis protein, partial [Escherichia coli]|nr:phage virion morphogenesis protein [Escherichia coli]
MRTISSGLSPQALSRIAGQLARELRRSQQQRMRAQKAPDGTQWEPRRRRIS